VSRTRLDDELVRRGHYATRSRARDAILRDAISVDGKLASKPSQGVRAESAIAIDDPAKNYASRAALKLVAGFRLFNISPKSLKCLDIGASTGGFTQVLLGSGAAHVTAIDVGHGQMEPRIAADRRVTSIEGLNARDLTNGHLDHAVELIVCDVSFISLRLALPPALALAERDAALLALIKPQFEVGRSGDPNDALQRDAVCADIAAFISANGWAVLGVVPSPIDGGDGNKEFLLAARKR
jgi:23S rRNA (cytidine1920-2'-O)/16S rRNA (cytidine1409-2'-O)-methyltransferase